MERVFGGVFLFLAGCQMSSFILAVVPHDRREVPLVLLATAPVSILVTILFGAHCLRRR